jgi:antitoxin MazE
MIAKIAKWGNSLALRIPKSMAYEMDVEDGASVRLKMNDHALIIERVPSSEEWDLSSLLVRVEDDNLHDEWDEGAPRGGESW